MTTPHIRQGLLPTIDEMIEKNNAKILERVNTLQDRTRFGCSQLKRMGNNFAELREQVCAEANNPLAFLAEPILARQLQLFDAQQTDLLKAEGSLRSMVGFRVYLVTMRETYQTLLNDEIEN